MNILKFNFNYSNNSKAKTKSSGFTLIELSIVLVIIGLIIGGILVGQDLIRSAEARALISQIEKYSAAVNAFRNKFAAVPGDYRYATNYITPPAGVTIADGDGNGLIANGVPGSTPLVIGATTEHAAFWAHMGAEGLIDGTYDGTAASTILGTNFPLAASKKGGIFAYATSDYKNYWHMGLAGSANTTITTANNITPNTALQIDTKTDDGYPTRGTILSRGGVILDDTTAGGTYSGATIGGTYCVFTTPDPDVYNSGAGSAILCQLRILMM